jgi:hypothetical protein
MQEERAAHARAGILFLEIERQNPQEEENV